MRMADIVVCQSCHQPVHVPASQAAEAVCPRCGSPMGGCPVPPLPPLAGLGLRVVVVAEDRGVSPSGNSLPPPFAPLKPVLVSETDEPGADRPELKPRSCPFCGERILAGSKRCPYCREDVDDEHFRPWERPGAPPRRDLESHRGSIILTMGVVSLILSLPSLCGFAFYVFGIPGIISLPLGLAAWALGRADVDKMNRKLMDSEGLRATDTGKSCGLVGAILAAVGLLLCGIINLVWLLRKGL